MSRSVYFIPAVFFIAVFALQAPGVPPVSPSSLAPAQIDQLLAPIALYPDPLLAQLLPASTQPLELAIAFQWLRLHPLPTESQIAAEGWDTSIEALVHYPNVLELMAENLDWTRKLGFTYTNQRMQVNQSIQRLRDKARSSGSLFNSPQQNVIVQPDNAIQIEPAQPDVIYVPVYDTADCFTYRHPPQFEKPAPAGPWLDKHPAETTPAQTFHTTVKIGQIPSAPILSQSTSQSKPGEAYPSQGSVSSDDSTAAGTDPAPAIFNPSPAPAAPVSQPAPAPVASQPEPSSIRAVSATPIHEPERSESSTPVQEKNNGRSSNNR